MKKIIAAIGLAVLIFIGTLLYNTFSAKPWPSIKAQPLPGLPDSAIAHLSEAIRIPTVSPQETDHIDTTAFLAYRNFLEKAYPQVHAKMTRQTLAGFSYAYTWTGSDTSLQPIILMAHYDVVPVEPSAVRLWSSQPFGGSVRNDSIYGRGAADDKGSMIAIFEAAEALLKEGFQPRRSIMLCFGHNEESSGAGARAVAAWLKEKNIKAQLVIDEGGELTLEQQKDVSRPIAMIGVGEKGYATYELSVQKTGGHSSRPDRETAIDILSKALVKMREKQTPRRILPATREFLTRVSGSSDNFLKKMAVNNLWLFEGLVIYQQAKDKDGLAMVSTTIVPTILESGIRENVIPSNAKAIVNSRILPGETSKDVIEFIRQHIDDDRVKITVTGDFVTDPTPTTDFHGPAFTKVAAAVSAVADDVIPVPYVMLGATDSRNFRALSDGVINFCPFTDLKGFHGIDERIGTKDLQRGIAFYKIIMKDEEK